MLQSHAVGYTEHKNTTKKHAKNIPYILL